MFILSDQPSIANQFIAELRDPVIQKDRMRFRTNLTRLGEVLAYEVSKSLSFEKKEITTSLGNASSLIPSEQPVLISVLRASLPFYQGFLNFFDQAENGFIGAFRQEKEGEELSINLGYSATPSLEGKTIIIADPMLASGKSILSTIEKLNEHGIPKFIHIVAAFAAPEGIQHIESNLKSPFKLWIGVLDEKLNDQFYIVPGLGDAGDLAFGTKL